MSYLSQFNYQILGIESKPKLVFLHGVMGFGNNWKTMARHFDENFQILLLDQRGHGRSFHPATGYGVRDFAEDLDKITQELGWSKFSIVGHSMGARVAVEFASLFPQKVEKLVLVDMGPVAEMQSMLNNEEKIRYVPVPFASRDEARAFFDGPFLEKYKNEVLKQFFYANLDMNEKGEMDWRFSVTGVLEFMWKTRVGNQWAQYKALTCPTLIVRGGRSLDFTQGDFDQVLKENSHIQGVVIEGAGHWVHVEKPQELFAELKTFLLSPG